MINIEHAKAEFVKYTDSFNSNNPLINLKVKHTLRVVEVAEKIAADLNLSEEDKQLASLIGLLHDIGRFEQATKYGTFQDKLSINHAELGINILFEDNLIRRFIETSVYDDLIKTAIFNHNRHHIDPKLADQALLHTKIIRDADKVDILSILSRNESGAVDFNTQCLLSDAILDDIMNEINTSVRHIITNVDHQIYSLSYIYDISFPITLKMIKDNKYFDKIVESTKCGNPVTDQKLDYILAEVNRDIDRIIKEAK